jgi:hypothetical protein
VRLIVGLFTCLTLGGLSQAFASDPAPQPPAATQGEKPSTPPADQSKTTADTTSPSPSSATAPAGQAATAPSGLPGTATAQSVKRPALTVEEKDLLAHGYTLEVRSGQNYFCRAEAMVGTRFKSRVCATAEHLAALRQSSKDAATRAQRLGGDPAKN